MKRNIYTTNNKGFSLIEMSLVLVFASILATVVVPNEIRRVQIKYAENSSLEYAIIQDAERAYYINSDSWADIDTLKNDGYLNPNWSVKNPWGKDYVVTDNGNILTVSSEFPTDLTSVVAANLPSANVSGDVVESSIPLPGASSAASGVEQGVIVVWSGSIGNIPAGWELCDGSCSVICPDLRDKFIIGAGNSYAVDGTGGSLTHSHTFSGTTHGLAQTGGPRTRYHDIQEGSNGWNHNFSGTTSTGSSLPPYYALAFIIKV